MITLVDGLQGSGKSYYGAYTMFHDKNKFYRIYTNLDDYKFNDNIVPLKFSSFMDIISHAKIIYDKEDTTDKDIWDYLYSIDFLNSNNKEDILPTLIVYDEAHNVFDNKKDLLVWLLTYHRHLYIDIILLTVDSKLIHYSYHKSIQKILHAVPSDKQIFNKRMKYQRHVKLPITDGKFGTRVEDIYLPIDSDVFNSYNSGDKVRSPYIFKNYIYALFAFILVGLFSAYYLYLSLTPDSPTSIVIPDKNISIIKSIQKPLSSQSLTNLSYLKINCFSNVCVNDSLNINLFLSDLNTTIIETDSKFLTVKKYSNNFAVISILASKDFLNLFIGAKQNEENKLSINLLN